MSGNSIGKLFTVTTFGESHGPALGCIVDGCPPGLENTDARSRDYEKIKDRFRPGHADYTCQQKYGFRDYRGGGRSSARETVMRVAAGAIARKYLAHRLGVRISGYLSQIGDKVIDAVKPEAAYENPFFCPDPARVQELEDLMWKIRSEGDSLGAKVT